MQKQIEEALGNPVALEELYRKNKSLFKQVFNQNYPLWSGREGMEFWNQRLNFSTKRQPKLISGSFLLTVFLILLAGLYAKMPAFFELQAETFYQRNVGLLVFPFLAAYFAVQSPFSFKKMMIPALAFLACGLYMNLWPQGGQSDTFLLAFLHLPLLLWGLWASVYIRFKLKHTDQWLAFLRFNGEVLMMGAILGVAGLAITGISFNLFRIIGIDIEPLLESFILPFGLPAWPLLAVWLTDKHPQLAGKITPVIARFVNPIVLVVLLIYLIAMPFGSNSVFQDREFLLVFNLMLLGVMLLIFFSIAQDATDEVPDGQKKILFFLSVLAIIINLIAFTAILIRISEWGVTPNRLALLVSNGLIFLHLLLVSHRLYLSAFKSRDIEQVNKGLTAYLPVYCIWAAAVVFLFPLFFGY